MEETMVVCAREGCEETFAKAVHNQRFCSKECCRIYTNARILAAYHAKKKKKVTGRVCKSKTCETLLSRYNPEDHCANCSTKSKRKQLESWGWDIDEEGYAKFV